MCGYCWPAVNPDKARSITWNTTGDPIDWTRAQGNGTDVTATETDPS